MGHPGSLVFWRRVKVPTLSQKTRQGWGTRRPYGLVPSPSGTQFCPLIPYPALACGADECRRFATEFVPDMESRALSGLRIFFCGFFLVAAGLDGQAGVGLQQVPG